MSDFCLLQRKDEGEWLPLTDPDSGVALCMDVYELEEFIDMFTQRGGIKLQETYRGHPVYMTGISDQGPQKARFKLYISYDKVP